MRATTLFIVPLAALLAACGRGAAVTGAQGARLTLSRPASVVVERGGTSTAEISVSRINVPGEVTVKFAELPRGVEMTDARHTIAGDDGTFTLRASDSADLVEHHVAQVTVTGSDGASVTQPIEITVIEKLP